MQNAGLGEAQAGINTGVRNINNLRFADDTTLMAERKRTWRASWWKRKKSENAGLELSIQKMKIMTSGPITSWQIDGETTETVTDFIFLGSKSLQMVTAAMKLKDAFFLEEKLWPT